MNLETGESYLAAWKNKDIDAIASFLDPDVHFKGPMTEVDGAGAVLAGAQRMLPMLRDLQIRSKFASGNQAIFTYDFICQEPIGVCRTAELMTFENDRIKSIELFFDARPFEKLAKSRANAA